MQQIDAIVNEKGLPLVHSQKNEHLVPPVNQGDRVLVRAKTIINEVKRVWHKGFWDSSTKKRSMILG